MTTTTNSFVAIGPAQIGFEAKWPRNAFKFGALTVGGYAGVYGAIADLALPPVNTIWDPAGVVGTSNNQHGVFGISWTRCGVMGQWGLKPAVVQSMWPPPRAGVMGLAQDTDGVVGWSDHGTGVIGKSFWGDGISGESTYAFAVEATTYLGDTATRGQTTGGTGVGVTGMAANSAGVLGFSGSGGPPGPPTVPGVGDAAGVVGKADQRPGVIGASNGFGVFGYSGNADPTKLGIGVLGQADPAVPSNFAGAFNGRVQVNGDLIVPAAVTARFKSAIVPFPDGSHRLLHCMESPEHWFEDFGAAKLKRGRTVVRLDPDFAKVIKRGGYKVFLTPEGDCRGLYVRKSAVSFEVRELMGGTSSVAFAYRIVGRRKDIKGHRRFAKIDPRLVLPRERPAGVKVSHPTLATLRAFAARIKTAARVQIAKKGHKRKGSASRSRSQMRG